MEKKTNKAKLEIFKFFRKLAEFKFLRKSLTRLNRKAIENVKIIENLHFC